jgi:quercetin dioxygenase-like cupin family protein
MNMQSNNFLLSADIKATNPGPGLTRKILGYNNQIMMVEVHFAKDAIGYKHQHFHSQTTYVISGVFEVTIGEKTQLMKAGDGFFIEPNLIHGAVCLEEGVLIDVFSPVREDFLI